MQTGKEPRTDLRHTRFEIFEERLALSAQPIGSFLPNQDHGLEQHYEEVSPLELTGDFLLESQIDQHDASLTTQLNDAHNMSGVRYVHDTFGFDGAGQTVAIIDSGIAYDHLALGGGYGSSYRVVGGYDFAENDSDPYDDGPAGFHGTHVAGIVGSDDATHSGVASGVDLVALRVFDDQGAGYFSWVEDALNWVHQHRNDFANPITTVNLSLGTTWNSDSIPNWANLEDEFAQLKADGIFIAVSAGNSFSEYNSAGLSYPAASPYVVPVASVDNGGNFSSFSQRNDRVLAAPGRSITSTVPDHVFGADGNPNDFGSASGTSMASPYVAGASALVRQAMEFMGYQGITQDTIYNHLRDTATQFFDAATNATYHRMDVQAALNALMPEDDFGSNANAAHNLGTLSGNSTVNGLIGTTADQDFFTFTAGATGTFEFTVDTTHDLALNAQLVGGTGTFENNVLSFEATEGTSYTISFGTDDGIGFYEANIDLEQSEVTTTTTVKVLEQGGSTYSLDSDGWLSVDGNQVWSQTKDFSFGSDGSLYWLSTMNGLLQHRTDQGWQTLGYNVVKYAVSESNSVYSLDASDWLSVDGNRVWSKTGDFDLANDGSLVWLSNYGLLQHRTESGWQTLGWGVVKYAISESDTIYSLDNNDWLSVNGNRVWSMTGDFDVADDGSLYWLSNYGLLQRQTEGNWETIDTGVVSMQMESNGVTYQRRDGIRSATVSRLTEGREVTQRSGNVDQARWASLVSTETVGVNYYSTADFFAPSTLTNDNELVAQHAKVALLETLDEFQPVPAGFANEESSLPSDAGDESVLENCSSVDELTILDSVFDGFATDE